MPTPDPVPKWVPCIRCEGTGMVPAPRARGQYRVCPDCDGPGRDPVSIQAIAWVFDHSSSQGIPRLVLLALANHANAETGECHPGQRRIAREANCSTGMVGVAVKELIVLGEVVIAEPGRGRATTKYHLPWLSTDLDSARSESRTTNPVVRDESAVVRDGAAVVREIDPVVRDLDRAKPEPVNRTARSASADAGASAPKPPQGARDEPGGIARPTRDAAEIAARDKADREAATRADPAEYHAAAQAMRDQLGPAASRRYRETRGNP